MNLYEVETHQVVKRFYKVRGESITDAHRNLVDNKGAEDMRVDRENENIFTTKFLGAVEE